MKAAVKINGRELQKLPHCISDNGKSYVGINGKWHRGNTYGRRMHGSPVSLAERMRLPYIHGVRHGHPVELASR